MGFWRLQLLSVSSVVLKLSLSALTKQGSTLHFNGTVREILLELKVLRATDSRSLADKVSLTVLSYKGQQLLLVRAVKNFTSLARCFCCARLLGQS